MKKVKIGIIREGKVPQDKRVPLTPQECLEVQQKFPQIDLYVQPSAIRTFKDNEYSDLGIQMKEDLSDCEVLMGVKEVPLDMLIPHKTYFFFSHTTKKQPYNQKLLQAIIDKKIQIVDWEHLTDTNGIRVIAFGRYAGIVGAYNGILTYGKRYDFFQLKPANQCFDMNEMQSEYTKIRLPNIKIVLTGNGRVSKGCMEVLDGMNIKKVDVNEFLTEQFDEAVYCQINVEDYNKPKDASIFDKKLFYSNPELFESNFLRFAEVSDVLIAGAFWDNKAPKLFTQEDVKNHSFKIKVIADVTMDIDGSAATTQQTATIEAPNYDYVRASGEIVAPFSSDENITIMAVDNLPCELPRNASNDFGRELINNVLPNLLEDSSNMIKNASITTLDGKLNPKYSYLEGYVKTV